MDATLCHLISGERLLLKKASRGTSLGKWKRPGGKIERGERPEDSARRELLEETDLVILGDMYFHGTITYVLTQS
jgi:8-oxo-dGTP diphosphatase